VLNKFETTAELINYRIIQLSSRFKLAQLTVKTQPTRLWYVHLLSTLLEISQCTGIEDKKPFLSFCMKNGRYRQSFSAVKTTFLQHMYLYYISELHLVCLSLVSAHICVNTASVYCTLSNIHVI